jgi:hypothetical protein
MVLTSIGKKSETRNCPKVSGSARGNAEVSVLECGERLTAVLENARVRSMETSISTLFSRLGDDLKELSQQCALHGVRPL